MADHADSARTYFRRVSIEYAQSPWADQALLRLSQLAFAAGDFASAAQTAARIVMDYPLSDVRGEAAFWAGRAAFELGNVVEGCRHLETADELTTEDLELKNRIRYYHQRCARLAQADTTAADSGAGAEPAPEGTVYTVQVAAVQSPAAADELMRQLHDEGYDPHVVRDPDDGLFKVRVGRFSDRAEAVRLQNELEGKLGGQPFVVEES